MAKSRNEFVQFAGHFQSLAVEVSRRLQEKYSVNIVEAIERAVQPSGVKALDAIAEVLAKLVQSVKNIFRITVGDGRSTEELVRDGNYSYANSYVTSANFPVRFKKREQREIVLLEFDHDVTSEQAIAEAIKQGLERPVYEDTLYFGVEHPEVQRERPVVFLHEPWLGPRRYRLVLFLWSFTGFRRLSLDWFDIRWDRDFRFAFVRK